MRHLQYDSSPSLSDHRFLIGVRVRGCKNISMASPTEAPAPEGLSRPRVFGGIGLITLLALSVLLILCVVFSFATRDAMLQLQSLRAQSGPGSDEANQKAIVDQRPWKTIQALAPLAVSAEEKEFAHDAERLADHEVDQAFASALRMASLQAQRRTLTGDALALSQKVAQLGQLVQQDKAQVAALTPKSPAASSKQAAQPAAGTDDLEVAKAQLELDSDELADAQHELEQVSGDNSNQINAELAAHEAAMRQYDSKSKDDGQLALLSVKQNRTVAERIAAWFSQRSRYQLLQQALQQTQNDISALTSERNALQSRVKASAAAPPKDAKDHAAWLTAIKDRNADRQILAICDDRIQTSRQLASVYGKWSAQVLLQHRILLHLILQSLAWILLVAICMMLGDALVRHFTAHPKLDRRQAQTLRRILELGVQVLGLLIILLMVFGYPQQTAALLGLLTAALAVALQDVILAFFGWFVLAGKHGISPGDRVEINGVCGEVTEVGLLSTKLLETGDQSGPGHLTGRRVSISNSFAVRGQYFNFTTTGQWLWDEITVGVPANQDIQTIAERIRKAVLEETEKDSQAAKQELESRAHWDSLRGLSTTPDINLRPSPTGIDIEVRFITRASERTEIRNRLNQRMIELLHA